MNYKDETIKNIIFNNNIIKNRNKEENDENEGNDGNEGNEGNDETKINKVSEETKINKVSEENIRIIKLSNNNESVKFSNNENIIFENTEENNVMKFLAGEQNIIIEEEVAIKDENIIYKDDIVYLTELENQLLSEYPITEQGSKYLQKIIENISKKLLEVKNEGVKNNELNKKGIEYNLVNDIINDKFNSNFIIPIVLDKHRIYVKLQTDNSSPNDNIDTNKYFYESLENKDGIFEDNQFLQLVTLKNLYHDRVLNKIDFKSFLNQINNIVNPYDIKYNNNENVGYIKKPNENTLVLRYNDINTIYS